jgi:GTP-binding protein Era
VAAQSSFDMDDLPEDHRSGFVAVVGRPNVGKSTLINRWLGQKIAIVSPNPQTTRNRLRGVLTLPKAQIVFVDTPGLHDPVHKLGKFMVETTERAMQDADLILWVVDLTEWPGDQDQSLAELISSVSQNSAAVLVLNKTDLVSTERLASRSNEYARLVDAQHAIGVSALTGSGLDQLQARVIELLPPGPRYYPADQVTDQQERFIVGELVREQVLRLTHQEVPHATAVIVEEFKRRSAEMLYIQATIYVERDSQKGILLGSGGRLIRSIGQAARRDIEEMVESKVYLDLWVKVRAKWRNTELDLRQLGYDVREA